MGGESLHRRWFLEGLERCARGARIYGLIILGLLALSEAYSVLAERELLFELLRIRVTAGVLVAAIVWALGTARGMRRSRELALLLMFVMSVALHALAVDTGGQLSPQYDRMGFLLLGPAVLLTWSGWWALCAAVVVIAVYCLGSAATATLGVEHSIANLGRLFAAGTVTIVSNVVRERHRWRELSREHALLEAKRRADLEIRRLNEQLERRVSERTAELHASEQRVSTMFDAAPIGVITVDASGRILEANGAFASMIGISVDEVVGISFVELTAPEDRGRTSDAHADLCAGRRDVLVVDKSYLRNDGASVSAHEVVAAVRDDAGELEYALVMVEDVSERVRAQTLAREHEERLSHVLRVGTMGEMATELAHELNQPLGAIVNFANGAAAHLRRAGAEREVVESVTRIAEEAFRAAQILRRVRGFVRPGRRSRQSVELNGLVREVVALIEADARKHRVSLRLDLDPALPCVSVDVIQIEQVMVNLMRNALDAVKEAAGQAAGEAVGRSTAGEIASAGSTGSTAGHELVVQTRARSSSIELRVSDTGPGVAESDQERMFDAYYTTKPGGLGMGLSISRTIVEGHGGRIWARANDERGMTVGFRLPVGRDGAAVPLVS